jgi:hypothetical protein
LDTDNEITEIARVAPVGIAYQYIRNQYPKLFNKLYSWDDFHPSPYGTWLQACILYITIFEPVLVEPPKYNGNWWKYSRYIMPPPDGDQYYQVMYPTEEEAELLRQIAIEICKNKNKDTYGSATFAL